MMDKLAEEDWRRLRAFTGQSTLTTYIGALSLRLLEDFARIRFGRVKPPSWVQRLGGIWKPCSDSSAWNGIPRPRQWRSSPPARPVPHPSPNRPPSTF